MYRRHLGGILVSTVACGRRQVLQPHTEVVVVGPPRRAALVPQHALDLHTNNVAHASDRFYVLSPSLEQRPNPFTVTCASRRPNLKQVRRLALCDQLGLGRVDRSRARGRYEVGSRRGKWACRQHVRMMH